MAARANSIRSDDLLHGLMLLVRGCEEKMIRVPRWALAALMADAMPEKMSQLTYVAIDTYGMRFIRFEIRDRNSYPIEMIAYSPLRLLFACHVRLPVASSLRQDKRS